MQTIQRVVILIVIFGQLSLIRTCFLEKAALEFIRLHFKEQSQYLVNEENQQQFIVKDLAERVIRKVQKNFMIPIEINEDPFRDFYCKIYFVDSAYLFV